MTTTLIERLDVTSALRAARGADLVRDRADDVLAGRTVWCAGAAGRGRRHATAVTDRLLGQRQGFNARLAEGIDDDDGLTREGIASEDVVVLTDGATVALAEAIHERGAHTVIDVGAGREASPSLGGGTRRAIDAYILTGRRAGIERIMAVIPAIDLIVVREVPTMRGSDRREQAGWSGVLATIVEADRVESVGGTLRPRPAVAAR